MGKSIELTQENFSEVIDNNDLVFVDFWASWCGPCKSFGPVFDAAAEQNKDAIFAKINTEEQQELAQMFQVRSIPTLMVFKEQIVVFSQAGALPAPGLDQLINNAKGLDMELVRAEIKKKETESKQATA